MKFGSLLVAGAAAAFLNGCGQPVNDARLTIARQELREQCAGDDTYSCRNKTIDFNIMVLQLTPFKNDIDKAQVVAVFGDKGWDLYQKVADEFVEEGENTFDKMRPNIFARWFFGDSQPVSRQGYVMEYSPQDMVGAGHEVERRFFIRAKKEGLTPTEEAMKAIEARKPQVQVPTPPSAPVNAAPGEITPALHSQEITGMDPSLALAITNYTDALDKDGGTENTELRKVVRLDLNNDGAPDAAVIYIIEGVGGAQTGYAFVTGFVQEAGTWRASRESIQIGGSVQSLAFEKPGIIAVDFLTSGPDDPDCCPSVDEHQRFVWSGEKFVELPVTRAQ